MRVFFETTDLSSSTQYPSTQHQHFLISIRSHNIYWQWALDILNTCGKELKAAVLQQLHTPPVPAVIIVDTINEPEPQATTVAKAVWPLNAHPFEILLMGARNTGMADGLQEVM
jgi:hypothetical protein